LYSNIGAHAVKIIIEMAGTSNVTTAYEYSQYTVN